MKNASATHPSIWIAFSPVASFPRNRSDGRSHTDVMIRSQPHYPIRMIHTYPIWERGHCHISRQKRNGSRHPIKIRIFWRRWASFCASCDTNFILIFLTRQRDVLGLTILIPAQSTLSSVFSPFRFVWIRLACTRSWGCTTQYASESAKLAC